MDKTHYYQCQNCGEISKAKFEYKTEDIFVDLWCDQCATETPQLYIGADLLEKYELYNVNLDQRYFIY